MISQRAIVTASLLTDEPRDHHHDVYTIRPVPQTSTCVCGHLPGDHHAARTPAPLPAQHGPCLIPGCGCRVFTQARQVPGTPRAA